MFLQETWIDKTTGDFAHGVVGKRNDALMKLLNATRVSKAAVLENLVANPAPADIVALLAKPRKKVWSGEEVCFGLMTDIYKVVGRRRPIEEGLLMVNLDLPDRYGFDLKVWYID